MRCLGKSVTESEIKGAVRLAEPVIVCEYLASEWCHEYTQAAPHIRVFLNVRERNYLRSGSPELDDVVLSSGRIEREDLVHSIFSTVKLVMCKSGLSEAASCYSTSA